MFHIIVLNLESSPALKSRFPVLREIKVVIISCQMVRLGCRIVADKLVGSRSNRSATDPGVERIRPPVSIWNTRQHVGGND